MRPNRAPKTYQGYELVVRRHIIPVLGRRRLKKLAPADVRILVQRLNGGGLGTRMVQFVHAVLRNALQHAVREEVIARNVARLVEVRTPKYDVGRGLTVDKAKALLEAARGERLEALLC